MDAFTYQETIPKQNIFNMIVCGGLSGIAAVLKQAGVPTVDGTNYFTNYDGGITEGVVFKL